MEKFLNGNPSFLISAARVSGNQSQNSPLTYGPDGGVSFKQRILGWLRENLDHVAKRVVFEIYLLLQGFPQTNPGLQTR
jgi:hypothetical protein